MNISATQSTSRRVTLFEVSLRPSINGCVDGSDASAPGQWAEQRQTEDEAAEISEVGYCARDAEGVAWPAAANRSAPRTTAPAMIERRPTSAFGAIRPTVESANRASRLGVLDTGLRSAAEEP